MPTPSQMIQSIYQRGELLIELQNHQLLGSGMKPMKLIQVSLKMFMWICHHLDLAKSEIYNRFQENLIQQKKEWKEKISSDLTDF